MFNYVLLRPYKATNNNFLELIIKNNNTDLFHKIMCDGHITIKNKIINIAYTLNKLDFINELLLSLDTESINHIIILNINSNSELFRMLLEHPNFLNPEIILHRIINKNINVDNNDNIIILITHPKKNLKKIINRTSLLHIAVIKKNYNIIELLLNSVDININEKINDTYLGELPIVQNDTIILQMFRDKGYISST